MEFKYKIEFDKEKMQSELDSLINKIEVGDIEYSEDLGNDIVERVGYKLIRAEV